MQLTLSFDEALALATSRSPLPPVVRSIGCDDSTLFAELDLTELDTTSLRFRLAAIAAGPVSVTARLANFADGVAHFALTVHARGLPAHKLLPMLLARVNTAIAESPAVAGILSVEIVDDEPFALVALQSVVDERAPGFTITALTLEHEELFAVVRVG